MRKILKSASPLPLLNSLVKRRHRTFALGPPKSGTTSIASIFQDHCRVDHEPNRPATVAALFRHYKGDLDDRGLADDYRARDKQLLLHVESNCFLTYRPDILAATFPDSRYIICVREPRSWLVSILDNNINFPRDKTRTMRQWHEVFFQRPDAFTSEDKPLADHGLYPLASYLNFWAETYTKCFTATENERRMIVRTNAISLKHAELIEFAEVAPSNPQEQRSHANRTEEKHNIVDQLNHDYVSDQIELICQPILARQGL